MKEVRFWFFWQGSWVKIKMSDNGEVYEFGYSSSTDEGWESKYESFWVENGFVYRSSQMSARDCDGRVSSEDELRCHVSQLASKLPYQEEPILDPFNRNRESEYEPIAGAKLPHWKMLTSKQRDHAAERAGY